MGSAQHCGAEPRFSPAPLRTNLRTPTPFNGEAVKRHGYHDQGILVVALDDPRIGWEYREILKAIGAKLYGERRVPQCG